VVHTQEKWDDTDQLCVQVNAKVIQPVPGVLLDDLKEIPLMEERAVRALVDKSIPDVFIGQ
jgi:hypothetical protein